jgi:hypothetical protein
MQTLLEVAIGLTLTFAVMAVVVSSVMELISALTRMRAHALEQGIARMLDNQTKSSKGGIRGWLGFRSKPTDAPTTAIVKQHALIQSLSSARAQTHLPSYIDARTFATALLGSSLVPNEQPLIARAAAGVSGIEQGIAHIKHANAHLGQSLNDLWLSANKEVTTFRHEIEDWFDREMARVSGWYSRWTQWIMVVVALVVVIALNISAVTIGRALWLDPTLRAQADAVAQQLTDTTSTTTVPSTSSSTTTATTPTATTPTASTTNPSLSCPSGSTTSTNQPVGVDTLCEIGLPIGWNATAWPGASWYLVLHILGMIAIAIAASFGAPFWFDALNRLVNLRAGGVPPATAAQQRSPATAAPQGSG